MGGRPLTDARALIEQCQALGATLVLLDGRVRVRVMQRLPDDIVAAFREAKSEVLAELQPRFRGTSRCWVLEEWRRVSIPDWRCRLRESVENGTRKRVEYALWMLREVLEDDEYQGDQP